MNWGRKTARQLAAGMVLLGVAACSTGPASREISVIPQARPAPAAVAPITPSAPIVLPQAGDNDLRLFYQRLQNNLNARGLLRTDGGGPDTPFTDAQLARNFIRIALFDEYVTEGDELRARATASHLRRWSVPVRMDVEFGASIPADQRAQDMATVQSYAGRLARATRHPISVSASAPNFHVLIMNEADRQGIAGRIRQLVPGIADSSLRFMVNLPRDQLCIVVAISAPGDSTYNKAIAIVRGEHPDLLRKSCLHEELAQGLGLPNDSPAARPSIFNDDEEFGLLTTHDELLLRMLYDRRLRPGMRADEAAPIVRQIATELTGGGAS